MKPESLCKGQVLLYISPWYHIGWGRELYVFYRKDHERNILLMSRLNKFGQVEYDDDGTIKFTCFSLPHLRYFKQTRMYYIVEENF